MFGAVWCALAAVSTQVGDPGAEEHFQGVALTRCKDTVTPEDEATAEHLVECAAIHSIRHSAQHAGRRTPININQVYLMHAVCV